MVGHQPFLSRMGFVVVAVVAALVMPGCVAPDRQVIDQASQFNESLTPAVVTDPELRDYLQDVGERIIRAGREFSDQKIGPEAHFAEDSAWMYGNEMQFHFVNSKTLNAFTTGGNHMYIYTELFRTARSEDELAAVMAHEYAHIYGRHVNKGMGRQYAMLGGALAVGAVGYGVGGKDKGGEYATMFGGAALVAGQLLNMNFTRGDEAEADDYGFKFYVRAGWDPDRFGDFFQQLIDKGADKGPAFLSDHPPLTDRVAAVKAAADKLPASARQWRTEPVANASRFRQLQQRAVTVGKQMPTSEELAKKTQTLLAALPRSCLTPAIQSDQVQAQKQLQRQLEEEERVATAKSAAQPAARDNGRRARNRD